MSRTPDEIVEQWRQKRTEGWTTKAIAAHWGAAESTVRHRLGKTGKRRITDETVDQWRQKITTGWTLEDVAAEWQVSTSTIYRYLGPLGLRRRNYDPLTIEDAVTAYNQCGTSKEAATMLGVGESVVRMRLYEAGIRSTYPGGSGTRDRAGIPNPPRGTRRADRP